MWKRQYIHGVYFQTVSIATLCWIDSRAAPTPWAGTFIIVDRIRIKRVYIGFTSRVVLWRTYNIFMVYGSVQIFLKRGRLFQREYSMKCVIAAVFFYSQSRSPNQLKDSPFEESLIWWESYSRPIHKNRTRERKQICTDFHSFERFFSMTHCKPVFVGVIVVRKKKNCPFRALQQG